MAVAPWREQCLVVEHLERGDDLRVELAAREPPDLFYGVRDGPGHLVGTGVGQRVEDVGHGDDTSAERDRVFGSVEGVAGSVPPLVMGEGDLFGELENLGAAAGEQRAPSVTCVCICLNSSVVSFPGLSRIVSETAELPDVVEWRGFAESAPHVRRACRAASAIRAAVLSDSLGVLVGVVVAVLGCFGKPLERFESGSVEVGRSFSHGTFEHLRVIVHQLLESLALGDVARDRDQLARVGIRPRRPLQPPVAAVLR